MDDIRCRLSHIDNDNRVFRFHPSARKRKKNCRSNVKFDGIYQGEFRLNGHVIDMQSSKDEIDVVISGENIFR